MSEGKKLARKAFAGYTELVFYLGIANAIFAFVVGVAAISYTRLIARTVFLEGKYVLATEVTHPSLAGGIVSFVLGVIILTAVCSAWKQFRRAKKSPLWL